MRGRSQRWSGVAVGAGEGEREASQAASIPPQKECAATTTEIQVVTQEMGKRREGKRTVLNVKRLDGVFDNRVAVIVVNGHLASNSSVFLLKTKEKERTLRYSDA